MRVDREPGCRAHSLGLLNVDYGGSVGIGDNKGGSELAHAGYLALSSTDGVGRDGDPS